MRVEREGGREGGREVGSKNALGFSAYTGPKIVIGLRPWYKFDKRSDTGSNIENIIPVILENASPI